MDSFDDLSHLAGNRNKENAGAVEKNIVTAVKSVEPVKRGALLQQGAAVPRNPTADPTDAITSALGGLKIRDDHVPEDDENNVQSDFNAMSEMEKVFDEAQRKLTKLDKIEMPNHLIRGIDLLPHQVLGVTWMVHQELDDMPPRFWYETVAASGRTVWRCHVHGFKQLCTPPPPIRGGVLGDDMGLGKTVQAMTLICANLPKREDASCTLIVAPVSVLSSWKTHLETYVKPGTFRVQVIESNKYDRLEKYIKSSKPSVVLVSYDRVVSIMKHAKHIFEHNFFRVILDEAHKVRSRTSLAFKAVCEIKAKHKWALTGSPFVNQPDDIASLLTFLNVAPLDNKDEFKEKVTNPIKEKRMIGLSRLRSVVSHVVLRRAKVFVDTGIPPKAVFVHKVDYSGCDVHRQMHNQLYHAARNLFIENEDNEEGTKPSMLGLVNRVRQICADVRLLPEEMRSNIDVVEGPKIKALIALIESLDPNEKAVIFSEWTGFLDLIEIALRARGYDFGRLDGSMKPSERQEVIADFMEHDTEDGEMVGPRFMLCSQRAAGVGITLTRANVVFLMSPWWNFAEESQAMDRVHRIGQTRKVRIYRMVVKDSIEERMLIFQENKEALGKGAFAKLKKSELEKAKLTAMRDLFEVDDNSAPSWDAMHHEAFIADDDDLFDD